MICLNLRIFGLSRKFVTMNLFLKFEKCSHFLEDKDIYTLCKFRTTNHKLPIATGRWNNIDRVNRICTKCDNITSTFCVLCYQCCLCLWIVHSWLTLPFWLTFNLFVNLFNHLYSHKPYTTVQPTVLFIVKSGNLITK
jgi:hypothetical protein